MTQRGLKSSTRDSVTTPTALGSPSTLVAAPTETAPNFYQQTLGWSPASTDNSSMQDAWRASLSPGVASAAATRPTAPTAQVAAATAGRRAAVPRRSSSTAPYSKSAVAPPDRGGFGGRVALTFDDGPSLQTTPLVLDVLAKHGIQATFFINGVRVGSKAEVDLLKRTLAQGHQLANHTHHHKNLATQTAPVVHEEIRRTDSVLDSIDPSEERRFLRFPYGSADADDRREAEDQGYAVTGWHVDSMDWSYNAGHGTANATVPAAYRNDMAGYVLKQLKDHDGGIVLFHDISKFTATALDELLSAVQGAGFEFTRLDDEGTFPKLNAEADAVRKSAPPKSGAGKAPPTLVPVGEESR